MDAPPAETQSPSPPPLAPPSIPPLPALPPIPPRAPRPLSPPHSPLTLNPPTPPPPAPPLSPHPPTLLPHPAPGPPPLALPLTFSLTLNHSLSHPSRPPHPNYPPHPNPLNTIPHTAPPTEDDQARAQLTVTARRLGRELVGALKERGAWASPSRPGQRRTRHPPHEVRCAARARARAHRQLKRWTNHTFTTPLERQECVDARARFRATADRVPQGKPKMASPVLGRLYAAAGGQDTPLDCQGRGLQVRPPPDGGRPALQPGRHRQDPGRRPPLDQRRGSGGTVRRPLCSTGRRRRRRPERRSPPPTACTGRPCCKSSGRPFSQRSRRRSYSVFRRRLPGIGQGDLGWAPPEGPGPRFHVGRTPR